MSAKPVPPASSLSGPVAVGAGEALVVAGVDDRGLPADVPGFDPPGLLALVFAVSGRTFAAAPECVAPRLFDPGALLDADADVDDEADAVGDRVLSALPCAGGLSA